MRKQLLLYSILILSILCNNIIAQTQSAFESLTYPRTLTSSGMGEQGTASRNAIDAMQYNPANLTYANGTSFSFYRNPFNMYGANIPLTSFNINQSLPSGGFIGVEYTDWDFGDILSSDVLGNIQNTRIYERSLAMGYAIKLNDNFSVGAQARYAWRFITGSENFDHLMFSFGANYIPELFENRMNIGLSLINFSTSVNESYNFTTPAGEQESSTWSVPTPAQINLGINGLALSNKFFDLNATIGLMKPLVKRNGSSGQSSFQSLFNDWGDSPKDITFQLGIGYLFQPVYLGAGISFFQEMYLGYVSTGPKDGQSNNFTHGFNIGLKGYGFKLSGGYSGRWHNNQNINDIIPSDFPWETFQFNLSTTLNLFNKEGEFSKSNNLLRSIILSGGFTYGSSTGRMSGANIDGVDISLSSKSNWLIESDFYLNERSAIFSVLSYSRMTETYSVKNFRIPFFPQEFSLDFGIETFSLESGFRYHPIESLNQFFVQGSFGVIRLNFVLENTTPRYYYKTFDRIAAGYLISVMNTGIMVIPKIGLRTIFMEARINGNNLVGFNQLEFGVNLGYKF